jgi:uncharacterized protein YhaN
VRITDIQVDGFGIWTDLSIAHLAPSLTVFFGRNETGKTTLLQFIRSVLYGFSDERQRRYLPPLSGGQAGGSLSVATGSGLFRIRRRFESRAETSAGAAELLAADGSIQHPKVLTHLLANVDEPTFNNVFAIGLRELQELATLNDTEASEQLYKLSTGLDRVSLVDVMSSLERSRSQLLARGQAGGTIDKLLKQRDALRSELAERSGLARRWSTLVAERAAAEQQVQRLQEQLRGLEVESRTVEAAIQVRDSWQRRETLRRQLESLTTRHDVSEDSLRRLERIQHVVEQREKRLQAIHQLRQQLRDEDAAIPWNQQLWAHRARAEALAEHAAWMDSLRKQVDRLSAETERLDQELTKASEERGISAKSVPAVAGQLNHRTLTALRGPARAARDEGRRLKQSRLERDAAFQQLEELTTELDRELSERGHQQLPAAIEQIGDGTAKLRRRLQLQDRLEKLKRHQKELEEDSRDLIRAPIMPLRQLAIWGSIAAGGLMLFLFALFSSLASGHRAPLAVLGAMGAGLGFWLKFAYQRSNSQELEECQRQLSLVQKHVTQAVQEAQALDADLPDEGGPFDVRLKSAEADLQQLESLMPLAERRDAAEQRVEEAERRVQQASQTLQESRARWQAALRKWNLPIDLTPRKLKAMADGYERVSELYQQLQYKQREKDERLGEWNSLAERITQAVRDVGLTPAERDPAAQLKQLTEAVAQHQQYRQRRIALRRQDRDLRRQRQRCRQSIETLRLRQQAVFTRAGVEDQTEFQELIQQHEQRRQVLADVKILDEQIRMALGPHCDEQDVARELESSADLQLRWNQLVEQHREGQNELSQQHQRLGQLQQELRSLANDRRPAELQLELSSLELQIEQARRQWQQLAVTGLALESIRRVYETERQPETLNEASKYLRRLTDDGYRRVWTPVGNNTLNVDDASGRPLATELLSQGTREAVFLSLRLALVAGYARRGATLPLVLDDVLVNLDNQRALAAARVIMDFAQAGHQVLLFTCHEHIADLFFGLGADLRELSRDGARKMIGASSARIPAQAGMAIAAKPLESATGVDQAPANGSNGAEVTAAEPEAPALVDVEAAESRAPENGAVKERLPRMARGKRRKKPRRTDQGLPAAPKSETMEMWWERD